MHNIYHPTFCPVFLSDFLRIFSAQRIEKIPAAILSAAVQLIYACVESEMVLMLTFFLYSFCSLPSANVTCSYLFCFLLLLLCSALRPLAYRCFRCFRDTCLWRRRDS